MAGLKLFSIFIVFVMSICLVVQAQSDSAQVATNEHNKHRRLQDSSNMKMMIWDEQIAQEAADYAAECKFAHDPDRGSVGENIYLTSALNVENIEAKAILSWYNEIDNYNFESSSCSGVCGHYTQVVWANSYRLGCGAASCPSGVKGSSFDQGTLYICRYGPPGNYRGQDPFKVGDACSECDDEWENCIDGLCARDDMTTTTTTTSTTTSTTTTTTDFSISTERNTISTTSNEPEPDSTSPPQSTSSTSTVYTTTTPGSEPTMEPSEPHCPTEHPDESDRGCSCCDRYEKALGDYEEKLRDWEEKYDAWKEKYHKCD